MSTAIYKKGQGYWTRQMSTIAGAVLTLLGAIWIKDLFVQTDWFGLDPIWWQAIAGVSWCSVLGGLLYAYVWVRPRSVDFLVATEAEMKKVNWSTRREILGSTWIVIGLTVLIAALCFFFDLLFQRIALWANVLESTL